MHAKTINVEFTDIPLSNTTDVENKKQIFVRRPFWKEEKMGNMASLWTLTNGWLWRPIPPMFFFSRAMSYKLTFDNNGVTFFWAFFLFSKHGVRHMTMFCFLLIVFPSCWDPIMLRSHHVAQATEAKHTTSPEGKEDNAYAKSTSPAWKMAMKTWHLLPFPFFVCVFSSNCFD